MIMVAATIFFALVLMAFASYIADEWYRGFAELAIVSLCIILIFTVVRNGKDEFLYYIIDDSFIIRRNSKDDQTRLLLEIEGKNIEHIFRATDKKQDKYPFVDFKDYSGLSANSRKYALYVSTPKGTRKVLVTPSETTLELLVKISNGRVHFEGQ